MKIKRIFECKNGHRYESKNPITTSWAETHQPILDVIFGKKWEANTRCKICGAVIVKEDDFVNGKVVMGAVRR